MFTTTVDSILKDFTVKIEKLRAIAKDKSEEADFMLDLADESTRKAAMLEKEAERADSIASRIEALVG